VIIVRFAGGFLLLDGRSSKFRYAPFSRRSLALDGVVGAGMTRFVFKDYLG